MVRKCSVLSEFLSLSTTYTSLEDYLDFLFIRIHVLDFLKETNLIREDLPLPDLFALVGQGGVFRDPPGDPTPHDPAHHRRWHRRRLLHADRGFGRSGDVFATSRIHRVSFDFRPRDS